MNKPDRFERFLEGFLDGIAKMAPTAGAILVILFLASFCSGINVSIRVESSNNPTQIEEPRP